MVCRPMSETPLESEAWRPSYEGSRESSVGNDYVWDDDMTGFESHVVD